MNVKAQHTPDAPDCIGSDMPPTRREGCLHGYRWDSFCQACEELSMSNGERDVHRLKAEVEQLKKMNDELVSCLQSYVRSDTTALKPVIPAKHNPKDVLRLDLARAAIAKATS